MSHTTRSQMIATPLATALAALALWSGAVGAAELAPDQRAHPATGSTAGAAAEHPGPALTAAEIANASHAIDQLIDADLAKHGIKANPRTTDEQFVRRAYLELVGRIPTFDEATAFISARKSTKRQELIHELLASEGWVSRQFDYFADLLRVETRLNDRYPGQPYIDWLKQSLRDDKPYDQLVRELLTADGHGIAKGNGATGYYVRDAGMPLDNMSNTVQVFLGTQLTCAQCHNHPNDKWTRKDYFEMAAFTAGTSIKQNLGAGKPGKEMREQYQQIAKSTPEVKNAMRMLGYTLGLTVINNDKTAIALPADYQYQDAKPGEQVQAHTMFGDSPAVAAKQDPRATYAAWMTSPANPRFTEVIANRMWKEVMGLGLIEPVDHLTDDTVASNPELMSFLTRLMVGVKYDLRRFQEILCDTAAWQRQATREDYNPAETYYFQGPLLRRLSAEQVWDSLLTLTVSDLDAQKGQNADNLYAFYEANKDKTTADLFQMAIDMGERRGKLKEMQQQFQELRAQMQKATPDQLRDLRMKMQELAEKRKALEEEAEPLRYAGKGGGQGGKNAARNAKGLGPLLRASELPQPAPAGHLLRTFGQSDRQLIDNSSASPAVTQALTLLNGFIDAEVLSERSVLSTTLAKVPDAPNKVRALFLMILARQPTSDELALAMKTGAAAGKQAVGDIAWALLNTNEFLFVQ